MGFHKILYYWDQFVGRIYMKRPNVFQYGVVHICMAPISLQTQLSFSLSLSHRHTYNVNLCVGPRGWSCQHDLLSRLFSIVFSRKKEFIFDLFELSDQSIRVFQMIFFIFKNENGCIRSFLQLHSLTNDTKFSLQLWIGHL